jgi:hypothetical protein
MPINLLKLGEPIELPAPASQKQKHYIGLLMDDLGWHSEQIAIYADQQGIDLVDMTASEASRLIDQLKRLAHEAA